MQEQDCALYYFAYRNANSPNSTTLSTNPVLDPSTYGNSICSPDYCRLGSQCDISFDPIYYALNNQLPSSTDTSIRCCGFIKSGQPCAKIANTVDTCEVSAQQCIVNPLTLTGGSITSSNSSALICQDKVVASQLWIGIVITLVAAVANNLGLNLQKLALRKRHEKEVKKLQTERSVVSESLMSLRTRFKNLYHKYSFGSTAEAAPEVEVTPSVPQDTPSYAGEPPRQETSISKPFSRLIASQKPQPNPETLSVGDETRSLPTETEIKQVEPHENALRVNVDGIDSINASGATSAPANVNHGHTSPSHHANTTNSLSVEVLLEKAEFQKELNFNNLIKNPVKNRLLYRIYNYNVEICTN